MGNSQKLVDGWRGKHCVINASVGKIVSSEQLFGFRSDNFSTWFVDRKIQSRFFLLTLCAKNFSLFAYIVCMREYRMISASDNRFWCNRSTAVKAMMLKSKRFVGKLFSEGNKNGKPFRRVWRRFWFCGRPKRMREGRADWGLSARWRHLSLPVTNNANTCRLVWHRNEKNEILTRGWESVNYVRWWSDKRTTSHRDERTRTVAHKDGEDKAEDPFIANGRRY